MTDNITKSFCEKKAKTCENFDQIPTDLYVKFDVKKGLRDKDGKGVVTGITSVSRVDGFAVIDGVRTPIEGKLQYRGYNVPEIVANHKGRYGYEEAAYLLIFGELPTAEQLEEFKQVLNESSELPVGFVRDVILEGHSKDIMNSINKSILTLAAYDEAPSDNSIENVLRQCIYIISVMPQLAVYGYQAYRYYGVNDSLIIHRPSPELSIAENILRMLRPDGSFTELEAKILDTALILHMEHGGGNNSTFTARVITSAGSDTYSVIAAALSSLKGPKHGGANIKVVEMIDDIKAHVKDINDEQEVTEYLIKILDKEAFDRQGLIYGMGHAVYSISDPRANVLKGYAEELAHEKGREKDLKLYQIINKVAPGLICSRRHAFTGVSANVDFYSGFIYNMLGIPNELFTPIFAVGRIVGWCAHRIEELISSGKIIRPAYVSIVTEKEYIPLDKRE